MILGRENPHDGLRRREGSSVFASAYAQRTCKRDLPEGLGGIWIIGVGRLSRINNCNASSIEEPGPTPVETGIIRPSSRGAVPVALYSSNGAVPRPSTVQRNRLILATVEGGATQFPFAQPNARSVLSNGFFDWTAPASPYTR